MTLFDAIGMVLMTFAFIGFIGWLGFTDSGLSLLSRILK